MFKSFYEWLIGSMSVSRWLLAFIILCLLGGIIVFLKLLSDDCRKRKGR